MTEGLGYTLADMCMYVYVCVCVCVCVCAGLYQNRFGHESNAEFLAALAHPSARVLPQYLPPAYRSVRPPLSLSLLVSDVAPTALHCITL